MCNSGTGNLHKTANTKHRTCISAGFMELVTGFEPVTSSLPRTGTKEKY